MNPPAESKSTNVPFGSGGGSRSIRIFVLVIDYSAVETEELCPTCLPPSLRLCSCSSAAGLLSSVYPVTMETSCPASGEGNKTEGGAFRGQRSPRLERGLMTKTLGPVTSWTKAWTVDPLDLDHDRCFSVGQIPPAHFCLMPLCFRGNIVKG